MRTTRSWISNNALAFGHQKADRVFSLPAQGKTALREAGKPPKVAITAIMRKLVILANALIRDGREWAPRVT